MTTVRPTVTDVSRSIARLDEHADIPAEGSKAIDGTTWTLEELRTAVALNLAFQLKTHCIQYRTTARDVRYMLASHGASPFTIQQHATAIGRTIRNIDQNGKLV